MLLHIILDNDTLQSALKLTPNIVMARANQSLGEYVNDSHAPFASP